MLPEVVEPAIFSANRRYRYELRRLVNATAGGEIAWVMLNPSTANEVKDDPTIRRCIDFSRRWQFRSLRVVNLLPIRTPSPKEAIAWYYPPIEPAYFENLKYIERATQEVDCVMMAWGAHGYRLMGDDTRENICCWTDEAWILGWTQMGQPKHPLYVSASTRPIHAEDDSRRWWR